MDIKSIIFRTYETHKPLDGECMAFALAIAHAFPEIEPVGGYVSGGAHWWLEIGGEIVDPISTEWIEQPTGPESYREAVRGHEALAGAIRGNAYREVILENAVSLSPLLVATSRT
ncbi:hypothetical protein N5K21_27395 [Rhizobium pusense]|uniref:hypothetical protein n=1 Tax=Agrobacterium pusense TaxID=648995 RepID=UPI00244ABCA3|nr:hypothetical protein [Agrobacterium pusense]MDH2092448.1 hypothetical protein [Agrobacterium pusense]